MALVLTASYAVQGFAANTPKDFESEKRWPKRITKINNNSSDPQGQPFNLKKGAPVVGDIYLWKAKEPKEKGGFLFAKYKGVYTLRPGTEYYGYIDTTPEPEMKLDLTLEVGKPGTDEVTTINIRRGDKVPGGSDVITVTPANTLHSSKVTLGLPGFRRPTVPFISIDDLKADEKPDDAGKVENLTGGGGRPRK
jgi:hypothetical protein